MASWVSFLAVLFLACNNGIAQYNVSSESPIRLDSLPNQGFITLRYNAGKMAATNTDGVSYLESNPFQSVDIRAGLFGYGKKSWHQLHHYPVYGIGVGKYWFNPVDNVVGNPWTAYLFFSEPLFRFRRSSLNYDMSVGVAGNWKPYDPVYNPEQLVIGSEFTGLLGLSLQYELAIADRLDATWSAGVTHFSNGRIRSPNRGLNLLAAGVSLRYRIGRNSGPFVKHVIAPFRSYNEFDIAGSIGTVTTFQDRDIPGIHFMTGSLTIDYARRYGYKGKYGVGFDWSYDESLKETYQSAYPNGVPNHLLYWPGIHLSHEYLVHRWSFVTQAGINLKTTEEKGVWFGRVALRYDISRHVFLRTGVRVYKSVVSDFIEWGMGYSFYGHKTS